MMINKISTFISSEFVKHDIISEDAYIGDINLHKVAGVPGSATVTFQS